jgi:hypothetical protein
VTTDKPAFFVHLESDLARVLSDSGFVLLPGQAKVVGCEEVVGEDDLTIHQLNTVANRTDAPAIGATRRGFLPFIGALSAAPWPRSWGVWNWQC